jgi:hypothetical protein
LVEVELVKPKKIVKCIGLYAGNITPGEVKDGYFACDTGEVLNAEGTQRIEAQVERKFKINFIRNI